MPISIEKIAANQCFAGQQLRYRHDSRVLNCAMTFSIFLPPQVSQGKVPVLYWLSGLTCTDENFVHKAGAQRYAGDLGVAIVTPDTSPRGDSVANDPDDAYDFGLGAGFYVNATQEPFKAHYQMYDYVTEELPELINRLFPVDGTRVSIAGHSMGGHGALTVALKNPQRYKSVSAFAPICSPINCPWGEKALSGYLGPQKNSWREYDATKLLSISETHLPVLVDQGEADDFLTAQLQTPLLEKACAEANYPMTIRMQPGYDHSYFFIASFIGEHLAFHASHLM